MQKLPNDPIILNTCHCHSAGQASSEEDSLQKIKQTTRAIPSVLMSFLIAFFPKCPFCWAVYMSMFGSLGLARLPYMPWLLPVLLVFMALHLIMLLKQSRRKGYWPFVLSLFGSLILLIGRTYYPAEKWLLVTGMIFIISGSLLNSFTHRYSLSLLLSKTTIK